MPRRALPFFLPLGGMPCPGASITNQRTLGPRWCPPYICYDSGSPPLNFAPRELTPRRGGRVQLHSMTHRNPLGNMAPHVPEVGRLLFAGVSEPIAFLLRRQGVPGNRLGSSVVVVWTEQSPAGAALASALFSFALSRLMEIAFSSLSAISAPLTLEELAGVLPHTSAIADSLQHLSAQRERYDSTLFSVLQ